mmetsp:Transcript_17916/g.32698  ORF Transcript_17916/g.32698 Transcript_17916/m.32698 type:complete len:740 (-) Transcript_17916:468-2687(-)
MLRTQQVVERLTMFNRLRLFRNTVNTETTVRTLSSDSSCFRTDREKLKYDVLIVGAGPAGLSAAIKLKQRATENNREISICVIEKGEEVGSHILSGGVLDSRSLDELFPDWKTDSTCPVTQPVTRDRFEMLLNDRLSVRLPVLGPLSNRPRKKQNYVVSLSEVTRWLANKAESLGVDVLPGFPGAEVLFDWDNRVIGVATADGSNGPNSPGTEIHARATLLAEGCRGYLSEQVIRRFNLRKNADPQSYALGIKEVWDVPAEQHQPGLVVHSVGWPLGMGPGGGAGGGFLYHLPVESVKKDEGGGDSNENSKRNSNDDESTATPTSSTSESVSSTSSPSPRHRVALGLVISLDYTNPHLDTFEEFERWRTHPSIQKHISGGTRLQYGARTLNEGGFQSIPELNFPGGALIGCAAGFLDAARMKGMHGAMLSGMMAAEACMRQIKDLDTKVDKEHKEKLKRESEEEAIRTALADMALAEKKAEEEGKDAVVGEDKIGDANNNDQDKAANDVSAATIPSPSTPPVSPSTERLDLVSYSRAMTNAWVWDDLHRARNVRPVFKYLGLVPGLIHAAIDQVLFRGKAPWTFTNRGQDHENLVPAADAPVIDYSSNAVAGPGKEGGSKAARLSNRLFVSGTNHPHSQASHLIVTGKDQGAPVRVNLGHYAGPETRYCPAGVYEFAEEDGSKDGSSGLKKGEKGEGARPKLVIHSQNCLHCKACEIKDPSQVLKWTTPSRGGPKYTDM